MEQYSIQAASLRQQAGRLSGGNAQRVVLARTVDHGLRCLVAAQPTRGLDVGATEYVWEMLASCRAAEVAVLLISTDLDEVLALADRCYVMYRGRFATELSGDRLTRDAIGLAMGGVAGEPMPVGEAVG
jgi:simple sugar transport system ATP-binding protein